VIISVVIPVFNSEQFVERCLQSLLSQTYAPGDYEVLVIDNGSTDASVAVVRRYSKVRLLTEAARGPYPARNRGIAEARGEVIAFTDPDCIPRQDWLEKIAQVMADLAVGVVLGRRRVPEGSATISLLEAYENAKDEWVLTSGIPTLYYGYTSNMAVRKQVLLALGTFTNRPRGADAMFVRRVVDTYSTNAVRYSPDMVVTHLELTSLGVYWQKVFHYGRHRQANNRITHAAALNTVQRWEIFRQAVDRRGLSTFRAAQLLVCLVAGAVVWHSGTLWERVRPSRVDHGKYHSPKV